MGKGCDCESLHECNCILSKSFFTIFDDILLHKEETFNSFVDRNKIVITGDNIDTVYHMYLFLKNKINNG